MDHRLALLHSQVAPVPFGELLPQVAKALGNSPFEVFRDFEREPYAAASIAQVHRAKLANGTPVILKICRPGIEVKIDADLRLLAQLADLVEREMQEARAYRPVEVVASGAGHSIASSICPSRHDIRAVRSQFCRRPEHPRPSRLSGVDEQRHERAGAHRGHSRR